MTKNQLLKIILQVVGVTSLCALFAVVMPMPWMAAIHEWLGLGEMPSGSIVEYFARSLSAFYALFGFLCLVLATDVERYRAVVWLMGISVAVLGAVMIGIDISAGMPVSWIASDGPTAAAIGLVLAWLSGSGRPPALPSDHAR